MRCTGGVHTRKQARVRLRTDHAERLGWAHHELVPYYCVYSRCAGLEEECCMVRVKARGLRIQTFRPKD